MNDGEGEVIGEFDAVDEVFFRVMPSFYNSALSASCSLAMFSPDGGAVLMVFEDNSVQLNRFLF